MTAQSVDRRRITIFLLFAFGISWATGLIIALTGGLVDSPVLIAGTGITLAYVLLATFYMWGPALANIFTRVLTREGWQNNYLAPRFRRGWVYWLIAWVLPGILTILGAVIFFWLFPQLYDPEATKTMQAIANATGQDMGLSAMSFAVLQAIQAIILAPALNLLSTFGEEFGWRGYLQPKLMPLGGRAAVLVTGVIWGVWHWPVILMGYNYGLDYPGAPWLGPLAMVWFTVVTGVIIGWLAIRGGSVWPAAIAHGALNGMAAIGTLFLAQQPNMLLGPAPVGLIGALPFTIVAALILILPGALKTPQEQPTGPLMDGAAAAPKMTG